MVWTVVIEGSKGCWALELTGPMESEATLRMAEEKFGHHGRIIGVIRGSHSVCFFPAVPVPADRQETDQIRMPFQEGGHRAVSAS